MSKTRIHNFVVSLDGYASGVDQSLEDAFGDAQDTFIALVRTTARLAPSSTRRHPGTG